MNIFLLIDGNLCSTFQSSFEPSSNANLKLWMTFLKGLQRCGDLFHANIVIVMEISYSYFYRSLIVTKML